MTPQHIEGLRELDIALGELPKTVAKNTLVRVGKKRMQPTAEAMRAKATGGNDLRSSIAVSTKLSPRQAALHRREIKSGAAEKQFAEVFTGAGPLPQAHLTEYGSVNNAPVGWGRSAWDETKGGVLPGIGADLWDEIQKSAARQAKRAARGK